MLLLLFISFSVISAAEFRVTEEAVIVPASAVEGAAALSTSDDFTSTLSEFDRASRMKSSGSPAQEDFLAFVAAQAMEWSAIEVGRLGPIFESIRAKFAAFHLPLPRRILLIKTTGREEGAASYCRGRNVVIPRQVAAGSVAELQETLIHELFHILSKSNPKLRTSVYALIGFEPCTEVIIPDKIKHRLITNPDPPRPEHYTTVVLDGGERRVVPILFSKLEYYDPAKGGSFFDSLTIKFMVIQPAKGVWMAETRGEKAWLLDPSELNGLAEKLGPNPGPILQPEEVLATYFVPLVSAGGKGVPEKIAEGMRVCLETAKR